MTMTIKPPQKSPDQRPQRRGFSLTYALCAAVVVVIIVAAVVALVVVRDDHPATAPAPTAPTPPAAPDATGFAAPQVDPFGRRVDIPNNSYGEALPQTTPQRRPGDADWLTAAPAGTRDKGGWQRIYGAVVPFSTSDGPTRIVDGVPEGYAHTPQGCALAANYVIWQTVARLGDWTLRERMVVVTADDKATFDKMKSAGKAPDRQPESVTKWMVATDGFRLKSYADDLCVVDLATRADRDATGGQRWMTNQVVMVWVNGAWKNQLPADRVLPQEHVSSLRGFTQW